MNRRSAQPDTLADIELRECVSANPPTSFTMIAGAGSGKTTSLVKGLASIVSTHGKTLRQRRQRIACITYTEIAAQEIWADVGNDPLVHVATIHSFLWSLIRAFQADIKVWVEQRIEEKLAERREAAANFGPRVQQRTRDKNARDIVRYELQREQVRTVRGFRYGTGSDYPKGVLGHDDIIKMVPQLLAERPLLRTLLAQQYPFLFVDESQDTMQAVVDALKAVDGDMGARFCLGFFGDPMQKIYATGIGAITAEAGWRAITKPENFRCPASVLRVANAIRRDGDGLAQTRGRMGRVAGETVSIQGSARIFILPSDDRRDERLAQVREFVAARNADPAWQSDDQPSGVKVLVVVHRMAAKRLAFGDLYAALNDSAPESFKSGLLDATAWPLRPFISFALPLAAAMQQAREFEAMQLLRQNSPLLAKEGLAQADVAALLTKARQASQRLAEMMEHGSASTCADVLSHLWESRLFDLDPRIVSYLNQPVPPAADIENDDEDGEELTREIAAMEAFLACPATQFWGYQRYIEEESPFSTQQGIKGAEFDRVLVVLDDEEGTHNQFSYEKYLGIEPPSPRDIANRAEGKETAIERTRRLFYVCCTRAMQDLAVVLFTGNPQLGAEQVRAMELFSEGDILGLADIEMAG